ncbi:MAG: glycosyltransferase family 2 protein [Prevotella sp.]|nr:glycosyltransferase family 2 protein [Prevotella sp.]
MKLSIIIPVYQVKSTLRRCLDSIIGQEFRDWQMILVDDASTDGSDVLCDKYVKKERRIQVIHLKRNGGLSAARNAGLEKAKGDYVTFVDSDDYIAPDTLKQLMELLNVRSDYDILEYPVNKHYGSKNRTTLYLGRKEYKDKWTYWLEAKGYRHAYAWNKIYRRELLRNVKFPPGRHFEDVFFMWQVLKRTRIIATTDVGMYYYCHNPKGISHTATAEDLTDLLTGHVRVLNDYTRQLENNASLTKFGKAMDEYYASVLNIQMDVYDACGKLYQLRNLNRKDRRGNPLPPPQPPHFPILPYYSTWKLKLMHYIGLERLCALHRIFRRRR